MIYLDFETRSEIDLRKCGAWKYAQHPSTEPICMAWAMDDSEIRLWTLGQQMPGGLKAAILDGQCVEAHNAGFERAIWRSIMVPRMGWVDTPDSQWRCSAALAAAHGLPRSLEKAAAAAGVEAQKDMAGRALMLKMCKPRRAKSGPKWHKPPEDLERLGEYCKQDVLTERALSRQLRPLREEEQRVWHLDQKINERGLRVDTASCKAAVKLSREFAQRLNARVRALTGGAVEKASQVARVKQWLADKEAVFVDSLSKRSLEQILQTGELSETAREVLRIRQSLSKTSTAKFAKMLDVAGEDGRARGLLVYHGALTGRWTGALIQPQNLPRNKNPEDLDTFHTILKMEDLDVFEMAYPDPLSTLSFHIRSFLIAEKGRTFYGGDFSSIEPRVLFWLAGDGAAVGVLDRGEDIYVDLAREIFSKDEISDEERGLGKAGILGCGYRMGAERLQSSCADQGVEIDMTQAQRIVDVYRSKYSKVRSFWYEQEAAVKRVIKYGGEYVCGKVKWVYISRTDTLYCQLPSKRSIAYKAPKVETRSTPWGLKEGATYLNPSKGRREDLHGGVLAENITQAIARDLMAYSMLQVEARDFQCVLTVHDEVLAEGRPGRLEEFQKTMTSAPAWAEGIPVALKAWTGLRYAK